MKYPIQENLSKDVCLEMKASSNFADAIRRCTHYINTAYYAGRAGEPGYPLDPETRFATCVERLSISSADPMVKRIYFGIVLLANRAYEQGVRDAEAEVA